MNTCTLLQENPIHIECLMTKSARNREHLPQHVRQLLQKVDIFTCMIRYEQFFYSFANCYNVHAVKQLQQSLVSKMLEHLIYFYFHIIPMTLMSMLMTSIKQKHETDDFRQSKW